MEMLAEDVSIFDGFPPYAINVYQIGDVLIDAGTRYASDRILKQLKWRNVRTHALTHAHPDHQGSSHAVCGALTLPLWCSSGDAPAVRDACLIAERQPKSWINRLVFRLTAGPSHPVARELSEGDEVGGFRVIATPGHTEGHVSFFRDSDRTLLLGDVLRNVSFGTGREKLGEPPRVFTIDPVENRRSARKLAALEPRLILFGHGKPLRDTKRFVEFVAKLPS